MSIKIIHLAKDNEIDDMECADCHAHLRHALEINGIIYGLDCGAKRLGWPTSKAKITKKVFRLENDVNCFKRWYEKSANCTVTSVQAGIVCELLGLTFSRLDPEFTKKVYEAVK